MQDWANIDIDERLSIYTNNFQDLIKLFQRPVFLAQNKKR